MKHAVQIRQLRHDHPDSKNCSIILKYARQFACLYRDIVTYMSVDDKVIISVGEPDLPIAATSRRHDRSLVPSTESLEALDHDFHIHGLYLLLPFLLIFLSQHKTVFIPKNHTSH